MALVVTVIGIATYLLLYDIHFLIFLHVFAVSSLSRVPFCTSPELGGIKQRLLPAGSTGNTGVLPSGPQILAGAGLVKGFRV